MARGRLSGREEDLLDKAASMVAELLHDDIKVLYETSDSTKPLSNETRRQLIDVSRSICTLRQSHARATQGVQVIQLNASQPGYERLSDEQVVEMVGGDPRKLLPLPKSR